MSLPTTAPAAHAASSTDARHVSIESGTSKRARSASTAGTTRSSSSVSSTSGPGPAFTPPDVEQIGAVADELIGPARRTRRSPTWRRGRRTSRGCGSRSPSRRRVCGCRRRGHRAAGSGTASTGTEAGYRCARGGDRDAGRPHRGRRDANGIAAPARATSVIQPTSSAVGCCSNGPRRGTHAGDGRREECRRRRARSAAGAASRFATGVISGNVPNTQQQHGQHADLRARARPRAARARICGPGSRCADRARRTARCPRSHRTRARTRPSATGTGRRAAAR